MGSRGGHRAAVSGVIYIVSWWYLGLGARSIVCALSRARPIPNQVLTKRKSSRNQTYKPVSQDLPK